MRLLPKLLLLIICSSLSAETISTEPQAFEQALRAYETKEYNQSASLFRESIAEQETAAARHNLAITLFLEGKLGEAAAQMERAVRLDPFNGEYRFKLEALRQQLGLLSGSKNWPSIAAQALTFNQWLLLASLAGWAALVVWTFPNISGRTVNLGIRSIRACSIIAFLVSTLALALLTKDRGLGIITTVEATSLNAAPAGAAPQTGTARPGERVRRTDQYNEFVKVETESGAGGWIHSDQFQAVYF